MASRINRLTAREVQTLMRPGRHADGRNLYLSISANGGRRWVFLYRRKGEKRLTEMGLGSARDVSLKEAREKAAEARAQRRAGLDPLKEKRRAPEAVITFGAFATTVIDDISGGFSNAKHREQWKSTLATHAAALSDMPINAIETDDVLRVLKPIWGKRPETASRVRGRIERVLSAAKVQGLRSGDNPARWRGHLDQLLPRRQRLSRGHHAALPIDELPAFMEKLKGRDAPSARALEFLILSATRGGETRGATWKEIDTEKRVWTIPADRMKSQRPHRVPLTGRMLTILSQVQVASKSEFVFPGPKAGKPLSEGAFKLLLDRMGYGHVTPHGFRSTFRDWVSERTDFANEVAEMALAHAIRDATEAAYRRGDLFERRRKLMMAWADYCHSDSSCMQPAMPTAHVG